MWRRRLALLFLGLSALPPHPVCAQSHAPAHKHSEKHTKTCGEGGEKDPKHPKWNPPEMVYLACGAHKIGDVVFASWGTPTGQCSGATGTSDSFSKGNCDAKDAASKVSQMCSGKVECKLPAGGPGGAEGTDGIALFGMPLTLPAV